MLGTFFALGSKSIKDLKPIEPTRDQTPIQILLHACSTIGLFSSQRTQCNTKCQNWPGLQKRFVQTILHFQITFLTASFIYCEHWTLSQIHSNIKNWFFVVYCSLVAQLDFFQIWLGIFQHPENREIQHNSNVLGSLSENWLL